MQNFTLIQDLIALLLTAFVGGFIMQKLRLPTLLGYLLGGLLLGTLAPDILINEKDLTLIGEIGIALLLFTVGVELSFEKLRKAGRVAVIGSLLQIVLLGLMSMLLLPALFGISSQMSLFLGVVFSLSSTVVVAKILSDNGQIDTPHGEILIAWLLVQDLAVVPILIFLPIFLTTRSFDAAFFLSLITAIGKTALIILFTLLFGKKVLIPLASKMFQNVSRELLDLLIFFVAIFSMFLFTLFGIPGSVGAFLAGLIISGRGSSHMIFSEIRPFRDLFSAIFFVLLGTLVDFSFIFYNIGKIFAIGLFEMTLVFVTTVVILAAFRLHTRILVLTAIGLFSVGEFAFIVAGTFLSLGLISKDIYSLVLSVSLLSLLVTPWQIEKAPAFYAFLKHVIKRNPHLYNILFGNLDREKRDGEVVLSAHTVICGHGRVGREISFILDGANISYLVIDFNRHALASLQDSGKQTLYGDPSDIDILDSANVKTAKVLIIALSDRHSQELIIRNALRLNPHILIICRSHFPEDRIPLLSHGANIIVQPEFEAGVSIARHTLDMYGMRGNEADEYIHKLRKGLRI